jgi:hypothetical protein
VPALRAVLQLISTAVIVAFALAAPAERASAQAKPVQADSSEYRELVRRALVEFDAKNWVEARTLFRAAHDAQPSARTLRGLGMVAFEMQEYVAAHEQLSAALRDPRKPLEGALRAETEALLARTRRQIGHVRLELDPPDAVVRLNGNRVDAGVRDLWLKAGSNMVRAEAAGYEPQLIELDIQGGDEIKLPIELEQASLSISSSGAESDRSRSLAESLATAPDGERDDGGEALTEQWWFWAGAGVLAVGIGTAAVLLSSGDAASEAPTRGTGDVVITTLSLP